MKTAAIPLIAMLFASTSLAAQTAGDTSTSAAPDSPADSAASVTPESATPESYSDAQIESFAQAVVKVREIQADAAIAADAKQEAMVAAVQEAGLDPQTYNSMSQAAQSDEQLLERIQLAVAERTGQPSSQ